MFSPLAKLFGIKVILTFHSANYEHKKWGKFRKATTKRQREDSFEPSRQR